MDSKEDFWSIMMENFYILLIVYEGEYILWNSTEGIHLTAYEEMEENYSSFIRDHMEGVGLLGKSKKLMTYFNNAKRLHQAGVSLSLDLEAYEEDYGVYLSRLTG